MAKIKRSLVKSFLNTNTVISPTWSLISAGVPSGTINMNPKTSEETYIADDNATISVESYDPTIAIESIAINGNAVYEWLDAVRKGRSVLEDAETELVNVWLYETPYLTYYQAEKQDVSIQCDTFGGEGGKAAKLGYTINYMGDPVLGTFSPDELAFVADPVLTTLTSLSVGGHTLTPEFDSGWLWYTLAVTSSTDTIDVVADSGDAEIAIDVDDTPVTNGEDATWSEGANTLTVEVTVGAEVVEYIVEVTYTAP
jgi:hypothetical protein